jgi:hypothetical protein
VTTIYYSAHEGDGSRRRELVLDASFDTYDADDTDCLEEFAAECAKDFHDNCDGWEARWPRVFTLYASKDGPPLARMSVDREYVPSFNASQVG